LKLPDGGVHHHGQHRDIGKTRDPVRQSGAQTLLRSAGQIVNIAT
jgi:hypothetical protein